jgi:hypothetical protein
LIEDEVDDQDVVQKLIELSETINADLEKYDKLRKGDFQGASQVTVKPMYRPLIKYNIDEQFESHERLEKIYKWWTY